MIKISSEDINTSENSNIDDIKSIFKDILIKNDSYTIGIDELHRIRLEIGQEEDSKENIVSGLVKMVMEIDNLPMEFEDREKYKRDIANIYQIGLTEGEERAKEYADNLKEIIEKNLIIHRKMDLYAPTILGFIIIILVFSVADSLSLSYSLKAPLIYGSIGGILSVIVQNNKFNIDYKVDKKLLKFEAIKLVILSNIMAIIGSLAIESRTIFANMSGGDTFMKLVYVLCGYSQTFIPNVLKNFEIKSEENDKKITK